MMTKASHLEAIDTDQVDEKDKQDESRHIKRNAGVK
jgi:hypothetical protein